MVALKKLVRMVAQLCSLAEKAAQRFMAEV